jgi:Fe2+ transport system protein B
MRSGDEPQHARSPLRLRLALAGFGLVTALLAAVVLRSVAPTVVVALFLMVAAMALVDLIVVGRQMRQGAHFQPGPDVPPYRPVDPRPRTRVSRPPLTERTRMRRYLTLMIVCLVLIVTAWFWVRFYSRPLAVAMSMVAAVLPPIAVIVANFGIRLPEDPSAGRGDHRSDPEPP